MLWSITKHLLTALTCVWGGCTIGRPKIWLLARIHVLIKPIDLPGVKITQQNFRQSRIFAKIFWVILTSKRSIGSMSKVIEGQGQISGRPIVQWGIFCGTLPWMQNMQCCRTANFHFTDIKIQLLQNMSINLDMGHRSPCPPPLHRVSFF